MRGGFQSCQFSQSQSFRGETLGDLAILLNLYQSCRHGSFLLSLLGRLRKSRQKSLGDQTPRQKPVLRDALSSKQLQSLGFPLAVDWVLGCALATALCRLPV